MVNARATMSTPPAALSLVLTGSDSCSIRAAVVITLNRRFWAVTVPKIFAATSRAMSMSNPSNVFGSNGSTAPSSRVSAETPTSR